MPVERLRQYLDENRVKYVSIRHSQSFTAQEIAASAHISGKELAKTVMVKLDGQMAMAVLPGSHHVDLAALKAAAGAREVQLAGEREFAELFPGCETGAMPPFGNLYDMNVFVSTPLADDEEIAFNAGSHTELIRLAYADFERLVQPKLADFSMTP